MCDAAMGTPTASEPLFGATMATEKQREAARKNVRKAAKAAREQKSLAKMPLVQRGQRFSVQPVAPDEYEQIVRMGEK
jgi:predicted RNA-binding protein with PUA-like domain